MNELSNGMDTSKGKRWGIAIVRGVVVCILTLALLTVIVKLRVPHITNAFAIPLIVAAYVISIGLGSWQVLKHRPKS